MDIKLFKKINREFHRSKKLQELIKKKKYAYMINADREQIEIILQNSIEFENAPIEEKLFLDQLYIDNGSYSDPMHMYQGVVVQNLAWQYKILEFQEKEEFEVCAMIKQILDIENREAKRIFQTYTEEEDFEEKIDLIIENSLIEIQKNK